MTVLEIVCITQKNKIGSQAFPDFYWSLQKTTKSFSSMYLVRDPVRAISDNSAGFLPHYLYQFRREFSQTFCENTSI